MAMNLSVILMSTLMAATPLRSVDSGAFEPVGPLRKLEFDAPDGYYQAWDYRIVCPANGLRATVHLNRYGKATTAYQPGVNAYVLKGADPTASFAKLGFHAVRFAPPFLVTLAAGGPKAIPQKVTFIRQTGATDWFSFELHWTDDGVVRASVDGQDGTVKMREAPERIRILGFSGGGEVWTQLGYFRSTDRKDPCRPIS